MQAPPGAGKTTVVPLALLDAAWLAGRAIVMLEPRRLAARAAAHRIAELHGERVGATVGYRMRGESRTSATTRIEVVTEGILTRRLQRDPTLDGVGLVVFDEFHERSLDADLGLALARRTQGLVREDLRLLVMSATLDVSAIAHLLGDAPVITSEGRAHPIDTCYLPPRTGVRMETAVVSAATRAVHEHDGDILVFLPGAAEIRRVERLLEERDLEGSVVLSLFGTMKSDAQDRVLRPDPDGRRKIVLATSIAETSLTIEGVRVVIDAGLARSPRFSPQTGMTRLETTRVSRASADQRRGRAGRLGPGTCYRLWPEHENVQLPANAAPEITSADLAPLALDLAAAGVGDPAELDWIDPPPPAAFSQAQELLRELDAIDAVRAITAHGREMSRYPVHPRVSNMLLRAGELALAPLACEVAALLAERDIFRGAAHSPDADLAYRVHAFRSAHDVELPANAELDRETVRRARTEADRLARQLGVALPNADADLEGLGTLVALAYPDRIAQRRAGPRPRFLLRNGHGAELIGVQSLAAASYLAIAELDDQRPESHVFLAAEIQLGDLRAVFADQIATQELVVLDEATSAVVARRRECLGAIVLREVALAQVDTSTVRTALLNAVRERGIPALPWNAASRRMRERMAFLARHDEGWPSVTDVALVDRLEEWLAPFIADVRRLDDLARIDLATALGSLLDWRQRAALDTLAPTHIEVPSGSRIAIDYADPMSPRLAVRVQEVFGLAESPRIMRGQVVLTLQLLSPAHRPVQVTRDLAGFWATSYFDVRKDLRGRYPKHDWPENPLAAAPTRRPKPRKQ